MAYLKYEYRSEALTRGVSLHVFLPTEEYSKGTKPPYKTLYFLPGYSVKAHEIITWLRIRRQVELKGIAVVIPEGDNSFYLSHPEWGTDYAAFVGKEIVEETRKMFPLSVKREDTYIGGISMGGFGAVHNGVRYKETFGKIAVLSPALDFYEFMHEAPEAGFRQEMLDHMFGSEEIFLQSSYCARHLYLDHPNEVENYPELLICCGRDDRLVYRQVKRFVEDAEKKAIRISYREDAGDHEYDFWEKMLDPLFSFLKGIPEGSCNEIKIG